VAQANASAHVLEDAQSVVATNMLASSTQDEALGLRPNSANNTDQLTVADACSIYFALGASGSNLGFATHCVCSVLLPVARRAHKRLEEINCAPMVSVERVYFQNVRVAEFANVTATLHGGQTMKGAA
jgi:hypothetical protein